MKRENEYTFFIIVDECCYFKKEIYEFIVIANVVKQSIRLMQETLNTKLSECKKV